MELIYTGEGKGKSTSALGKALQAIGKGISQDKSHRVLILQWLKGGNGYTEDAATLRESYPQVDHLRPEMYCAERSATTN